MDRRSFLVGSGAAAAAAATGAHALGQSKYGPGPTAGPQGGASGARGNSPVRLGIASYTFRKFSPEKLIEYMHVLKCPYVNLKEMHLPIGPPEEVRRQAETYRAAGLKITGGGNVSFNKDDENDIRTKFEYAKAAGMPVIICAPTHAVLPRLEKYVREYDIKLAIHNHGPEDKEFPSPHDVLKAVAKMDQRIGCCVDLGHATRAGDDVVKTLADVGPRLYDIHIKDLAQKDAKESQVAVGEGILPIREIFAQLIRMGYRGMVDLEYEIKPDDPLPGVQESFAYMRGILSGMGYDWHEV